MDTTKPKTLNPKPYPTPYRQMQVGGPRYEMTGFHAKRSEFEHEYDNDAELLISELDFRPTDTVVSLGLRGCGLGFKPVNPKV